MAIINGQSKMFPPVLRRRVGLNGLAFLNRSEGKKVPRDEMRIGERYSSRLHPGPFLFRDLTYVALLLFPCYFQKAIFNVALILLVYPANCKNPQLLTVTESEQ